MTRYRTILTGGLLFLLVACGEEKSEAPKDAGLTPELPAPSSAGLEAGRVHFELCATCHGQEGQGDPEFQAPALVNMAPWSVKNQLIKFRSGLRGRHTADEWGAQMADVAETLEDTQAIYEVVSYIDSLPDLKPEITLSGNKANGARYYDMICGACHGPGGQGSEAMQAPALVGVDDWYLQRQYKNFAAKVRGYHEKDKTGRQMAMMSTSLPDEQTLMDILVFLQSASQGDAQ